MPNPPTAESADLGDPAEWVDRYGNVLLRFAIARVENREIAEDLVQETFLSAFSHRSQFDGRSEFGTWLVAILRRKIADHHRQQDRAKDVSFESLDEAEGAFNRRGKLPKAHAGWPGSPSQLAENGEFWGVFQDCLGGMPMHLAQAFQMREFGMASVDEVSRLNGITPQNLAVRLHRARLLLRQCLDHKWFGGKRGGAR